jgi:hypothetical protein
LTSIEIAALAKAEWEGFIQSKTVKAVAALVVASTGTYLQGLLGPAASGAPPPLTFHQWLASLAAAVVALLVRHTLAGIEAKQDLILATPASVTSPTPSNN